MNKLIRVVCEDTLNDNFFHFNLFIAYQKISISNLLVKTESLLKKLVNASDRIGQVRLGMGYFLSLLQNSKFCQIIQLPHLSLV